MDKAVDLAATLAVAAAFSGNLPWFIRTVRKAQIHLIQESKASSWGSPQIPSSAKDK